MRVRSRALLALLLALAYAGVLLAPCDPVVRAPEELAFRQVCHCPLHAGHVSPGVGSLPLADRLPGTDDLAPVPSLRVPSLAWQPGSPAAPDLAGPDPVPIA